MWGHPQQRFATAIGRSRYQRWPFAPGVVSGVGADTQYDSFEDLDTPLGDGLYAVPGVTLDTDGGGVLTAAIEFWDNADKLCEVVIAELDSTKTVAPAGFDDYAIPAVGGNAPHGAWSSLAATIPAGSGVLLGCHASIYTAAPFDGTVSLEFGNGGSVVLSVPLAEIAATQPGNTDTCAVTPQPMSAAFVSWGTALTQVRCASTVDGAAAGGGILRRDS